MSDRTYSVRDLTERYAVNEHTILVWIRSGELKAINVGRSPDKKKPRWRITESALAAFELARTPTPTPPRTRRKKQSTNVIEFY
ncbi:MAG: helix-turn-helix domain-containing protein [Planctomycetia bacterium]|nr:helix-turn-helix domain-containing protein [Planctomycetia bacterium]